MGHDLLGFTHKAEIYFGLGFDNRERFLSSHQQDGIHVVAAVLYRDGKVLIVRRGPGSSGAGFWEFPGGKVEPGESPEQALQREIHEETGLCIKVEEYLGENVHQYPNKKIRLNFYWAKLPDEKLILTEHDAFQLLKPQDLDVSILSEADRPIVEAIRQNPRMKV